MLLSGVAAWAAFGVARHDPPIYLCNIIMGLLVLAVVVVKMRSERRVTRVPAPRNEVPREVAAESP